MELLQLRYFRTVAQMESITKAAEFYHVPQPSMSQTISKLEKELGGIKLFNRKNNRLFINDNGRLFLDYVNQALTALDNGIHAVSSSSMEIKGLIRILAMENRRFVMVCILKFAELYPEVSFQISHDFDSSQNTLYDLCVSSSPTHYQLKHSHPLIRERIVLALRQDHPLAGCTRVNLRDLKSEKFITLTSRSSLHAITFDKCRASGFEPNVPYICDDPYFVRKYISEGMGIAMVPEVSWAGRFRENTVLVPFDDPTMTTTSYIIWDEICYLSPAVYAFIEYLLNQSSTISGNMLGK